MADEGADRIKKTLRRHGVNPIDAERSARWFCTIHAFAYRTLNAATKKNYQVESSDYRIKRAIEEISQQIWEFSPDDEEFPRPPWHEIYSIINNAKMRCLKPGQDEIWYSDAFGEYHGERLAAARKAFDARMRSAGNLTFPDMIYEVELALREDEHFASELRNRFKWVIVDEGQDTNAQAMRILQAVAEPANNFMIVGDADQLMFRFTGATPEANLLDGFTDKYPDGTMFMLETNYRSTKAIVEAANKLIAYNYAAKGGPYAEGYHKTLIPGPNAKDGAPIFFDEYNNQDEEAEEVAKTIRDLLASGREPRDIFVGSRTRAQLGYLEGPLMKLDVPFINIKGRSFWESIHVRGLVDYVKVANDWGDKEALKSVYRIASGNMSAAFGQNKGQYTPTRFLGKEFLDRAGTFASIKDDIDGDPYGSKVFGRTGWRSGAEDLVSFVEEITFLLQSEGLVAAMRFVIDNGYSKYLKYELGIDDENDSRLDDLETVVDIAGKYETAEEFFAFVQKAIDAAKDKADKNWDKYVVLSTIHGLKGLERPIVFGIGWSEGYKENEGETTEVGLLPHTFSLVPPPKNGVLLESSMGRIEDERCMAFVLATRAKEELYISSIRHYRNNTVLSPSRFVYELGLISKDLIEEEQE